MSAICEYLVPFKKYAKLFVLSIHPDRHHGYPEIQKINASTTHVVNNLFKFEDDSAGNPHEEHNLPFFIWKNDKNGHSELSYKLTFKRPFDNVSGKSALGLFKAAQITVDFSVLDMLPSNEKMPFKKETTLGSDMSEGIKNSCLSLDYDESYFDVQEVLDFIRLRPYIQFEGDLSDDRRKVFRLCTYLLHSLSRLENKIRCKMPIIIISDKFIIPQFSDGLVQIPLSSNFKGT